VAIAIPGQPGLSAPATAGAKYSTWTPYITPIILAGLILAMVVGGWWWSRRRRGRNPAPDSVPRSVSV
jgi:hypothetical protein